MPRRPDGRSVRGAVSALAGSGGSMPAGLAEVANEMVLGTTAIANRTYSSDEVINATQGVQRQLTASMKNLAARDGMARPGV